MCCMNVASFLKIMNDTIKKGFQHQNPFIYKIFNQNLSFVIIIFIKVNIFEEMLTNINSEGL